MTPINTRAATVVGLTGAFILLLALSFYYLFHAPTVGATFSWNDGSKRYEVTSTQPWSQLKTGDVIERIEDLEVGFQHLLVDNIYVESRAALFSWFAAKRQVFERLQRRDVIFLVVREGTKTEVRVTPRRTGASFLSNLVFLHFIAGTVFFLIGVVIFYRKKPGEGRLLFLVMCLTLMLVFITNATSLMSEIVYQPWYLTLMNLVNVVSLPLGNALLLHFSFLLPRSGRFLKRFTWLVPFFYGVCIIVVVSFSIPAINALTALLAILTFSRIIYAFLAHRRPLERQQMKWVLAGFMFGLGPWVFINAIPLFTTGQRLMPDTIPAAFVVLIPLSMAFAVRKYRLMDIDAFLEGTFVYAITILVLGIVDFGFLGLLGTSFSRHPLNDVFLSLVLFVSLYAALRDRVWLLVRRTFGRLTLAEADTIGMFNERASGLPPERILETLVNVIRETFQPRKAVFAVKGDGTADETLPCFRGCAGLVNLWEAPRFSLLVSQEFYVALVIEHGQEAIVVLLLGELQNGRFYSSRDLMVLKALLVQAKALYENAILYEEHIREYNARLLEEQRHADEKETILKDLHDGIGGMVSNIHLLAESALTSSSPADSMRALVTISALSKEGLFELSSFLQSLDASEATLRALIAEIHHMGSTMLGPHHISYSAENVGADGDARPGTLFYLNVLRICREALTNVIKHSMARSVTVRTSLIDSIFTLTVEDDGVGLTEKRSRGRGMKNMETRARDIGGILTISSGHGVCVRLQVPVFPLEPAAPLVSGG